MPRFPKLRFSILSLILATVIVALGFSYYFAQRQATTLSAENQQLKKELGFIEVEDPDKFYFRELPCHSPMMWRFRVYVPDKSEIKMGIAAGSMDKHREIPEASSLTNVQTGQYEIVVSVSPIGTGNTGVRISAGYPMGQMTIGRYQDELDWLFEDESKLVRWRFQYFGKGNNKTIETEASGRVSLLSVYDQGMKNGIGFFIEFPKQQYPVPDDKKKPVRSHPSR